MISKRALLALVFAMPILVVVFGVLMGGYALAQAMQDLWGARVLLWIALAALMLLAADALLLLLALGINAVSDAPRDHSDS